METYGEPIFVDGNYLLFVREGDALEKRKELVKNGRNMAFFDWRYWFMGFVEHVVKNKKLTWYTTHELFL